MMLTYENSLSCWEGLNEAFLLDINFFPLVTKGKGALYAYDQTVKIKDPHMPPDFDFGKHFNYYINKWNSLVRNYVDIPSLKELKKEIEFYENNGNGSRPYSLIYQFTNVHTSGKRCLLSMVVSRRYGKKKPRTISMYLRASEITKRLAFDLLLFERIGDYLFNDVECTWELVINTNYFFQDKPVLLMYHAHKDVYGILKDAPQQVKDRFIPLLDKLLSLKQREVKYKIYRRVIRAINPDEDTRVPVTLARDCKLFIREPNRKKEHGTNICKHQGRRHSKEPEQKGKVQDMLHKKRNRLGVNRNAK